MGVQRKVESSSVELQPDSGKNFHVLKLECGHTKNVMAHKTEAGFDIPPNSAICDECVPEPPTSEVDESGGAGELTSETQEGTGKQETSEADSGKTAE